MRNLTKFLIISLALTGCASTTGVVPAGNNTFMVAREDNGPTASLGAIKAAALKDAGTFCAGQGKTMQIVKESDTPRAFGQFPQTSLLFQCR